MENTNGHDYSTVITYTVEIGGKSFNADCLATDHEHPALISIKDAAFTSVNDWIIKGMPEWVNVSYMVIRNSTFDSLEGLRRFPRLEHLEIYDSQVKSMAGVEACTSLKDVSIKACHLDTMAWVAPLVNIERLDLGKNDITRVEDVAGKQYLRTLVLNENKITSTAGLDDLPAIAGVDISSNDIRDIPNPGAVGAIYGDCWRWREPEPGKPERGSFRDQDNPFHEMLADAKPDMRRTVYEHLYYKERLALLLPDLRRRLLAGETIGMAYFRDMLCMERINDHVFGPNARETWLDYTSIFYAASNTGFDVNIGVETTDWNLLAMRAVPGVDVDDFLAGLRSWYT